MNSDGSLTAQRRPVAQCAAEMNSDGSLTAQRRPVAHSGGASGFMPGARYAAANVTAAAISKPEPLQCAGRVNPDRSPIARSRNAQLK
jgi:hypothetical protein